MKEISLTDFIDFVAKSGTPRLTKVRQLMERGGYDPASDFWKAFREGIVKHHQKNSDKKEIEILIKSTNDPHRLKKYSLALQQYKKFLGRKQISWFQPPRTNWSHSGLIVRINPELGLFLDGIRHVIKLYFKNEQLTKRKVDLVNSLMTQALSGRLQKGDKVSVLDVHSNKLYIGTPSNLSPLLLGEATSLVAIWDELEKI